MKIFGTIMAAAVALAGIAGSALAAEQGGTLKYATGTDPNTLNPQFVTDVPTSRLVMNIHETLIYPSSDGVLEGVLAESWSVSPDKLTWTFKLREGVKFHDGTDFDAAAVKFNFDRIKDKATESPRASVAKAFTEINVVDSHTVEIRTESPFAAMQAQLSSYNLAIMSPTAVKKLGDDYARNPSGTGAFKLESWTPGEKLVLARFDDYWGENAHLDAVDVRFVPEDTSRVLMLLNGDVDVVANLPPAMSGRVEAGSNTKIIQKTGFRTIYLGLNTRMPPFDNLKVRQAVAHAINTDAIVKGILRGIGTRGGSFESPVIPGSRKDLQPYAFDVDKAKALLAEAGFPDGFSTKFFTPTGRYPSDRQVAGAIQSQLQKIGITAQIESPDWGALRAALNKGDETPMFLMGKGSPTGDLDLTTRLTLKTGARMNNTNYSNPETDSLIDKQATLLDQDARYEVLSEILGNVYEDVPLVVLFYQNQLFGISKAVQDLDVNPNEFVGFRTAWIKK